MPANTRPVQRAPAIPMLDAREPAAPLPPPPLIVPPPPPPLAVDDAWNAAPAGYDEPAELDAQVEAADSGGIDIALGEENSNEPAMEFDPEMLKALGEFEAESVDWGEDLHDDIAKRFQHILLNGLKKESKEELLKKYLFPKNVQYSKGPTLNPEIFTMLTEASRNRDKRLLIKQDQLGKALTGVGMAMTTLLRKNPDLSEVIRILNDAGKLLADSHYTETDTRRALVIPLVDKSLIEPFKDRKRDSLLFGEKLGELVKNSQGIKRAGQYIQATAPNNNGASLNWKGPSSRPRQYKGNQSRGGGQRYHYTSRRRAPPPPPPPPPARRHSAQAPMRRAPPAPNTRPAPPDRPLA